jgi:RNA polymerase subunit RPABC4/transcription elongation factor Spt4
MEQDTQIEMNTDYEFCPECGSEESGFFCRQCGTLIRGEEMVLCPRCHQVVPDGEFCNQCGQGLGPLALRLKQLSMAGDAFWVTAEAPPPEPSVDDVIWAPDETVELAKGDLPDWLQELPIESVPREVESHIYPALRPIERQSGTAQGNNAFMFAILLAFVLMLGLVVLTLLLALGAGG